MATPVTFFIEMLSTLKVVKTLLIGHLTESYTSGITCVIIVYLSDRISKGTSVFSVTTTMEQHACVSFFFGGGKFTNDLRAILSDFETLLLTYYEE